MPTPDPRASSPAESGAPGRAAKRTRTIVQAVLDVMQAENRPLTAQEVCAAIQARGLYTFNSPTPVQMVRAQLRRHAEGLAVAKTAAKRYFRLRDDGRFELLADR